MGEVTTSLPAKYMKKRIVVMAPRAPYSVVDFSSFGARNSTISPWST